MKRRFLSRTRLADSLRNDLTPAQRCKIALHLQRRDPDAAVNSLCSVSHRNALRLSYVCRSSITAITAWINPLHS
jgi:hypothetical protein